MKNICLVGVGPHAKRIYFKYFEKYNLCPKLIVELKSKEEEAKEYLATLRLANCELILLDDKYKDSYNLNQTFAKKRYKTERSFWLGKRCISKRLPSL